MKPNQQTAAICGLFCGTCPFYPEQCHGCLSEKLTAHCVHCQNGFRKCASEHKVTRCFECEEFPCERLESFRKEHWENGIGHHTMVIEDLQYMKEFGIDTWVEKKTIDNTCPHCGKIIHWMDNNHHQCD